MSPGERRQTILKVLCVRRHDTCSNLANEFHVSERTIRRDIEVLMCTYPLETVCGRFGGGVQVLDGYYYAHQPFTQQVLNQKQLSLLKECRTYFTGDKLDTLNGIISQFAP